jgi:hypothetical protein
MRHYTTDSAEAMSRVVALALLADGALDHSELESLASHEIHNRLRIAPETLDRVIHEFCNDLLQCARAPNIGQIELDILISEQVTRTEVRQTQRSWPLVEIPQTRLS